MSSGSSETSGIGPNFTIRKILRLPLVSKAAELLELFLWKSPEEASEGRIKEELADVFAFAFLMADRLKLDVRQIVSEKIDQNRVKYSVEKSKGNARKYNDL